MLFWGKRKKAARQKSSTLSVESLERREMMAVMAIASGETLSFRDGDGTSVRVQLSGPGQGTLDLTNGLIETLSLTGTSGESELKISTSGGSIPGTTIRDLAIDNAIGEIAALARLYAPKVDVAAGGEWSADANIGELRIRDLLANSEIEVDGDVGKIKARTLAGDASIHVTGQIGEIIVDMLLDRSEISAEQIDYLHVKKSADGATIDVGDGGLQIAKFKNFSNSAIQSLGEIGDLYFKGSTLGSAIASNIDAGSDGAFGTIDDFVIDLSAPGNINKLDIRGDMGSAGSPDEVAIVASGAVNELKLGQNNSRAGRSPMVWEQAASQFIPLDISQITAAATGFGDDEIWIAMFGGLSAITSSGAVEQYYIDAGNLDSSNNPILVSVNNVVPSQNTPDLPILPSSTIQDWGSNLAFKVPAPGNKWSGRILISAGTPVQAQVAQAQLPANNSVSSPNPASPGDPSTGTFYDFLEFTVVHASVADGGTVSIDVDTSQVDSFGMPTTLQFFTDTPAPMTPFDVTVTGTTNGTTTISSVTGLTSIVGKGQPILGPGIQPGTMITNVVGNTITLNLPTTTSQSGGSFTVKPAGPVGVKVARDAVFSTATTDELYTFLQNKLDAGNSNARPFLESAAPYAVSGAIPIDGAQIHAATFNPGGNIGNLQANDVVTISGVQGTTALNGSFVAAVVTPSLITLGGPVGNGNYTSGGQWSINGGPQTAVSFATYDSLAIVLTTTNTASVNVNDVITIAGVQGNTAANGTYLVAAKSGNSITLGSPVGNQTYTGGGTWNPAYIAVTAVDPTTPIRVHTGDVTGLLNGDHVFIGGVQGVPAANGAFTIQNVNQTQGSSGYFDLHSTIGSGSYTGGGYWAPYYSITAATDGGEVLIITDSTAGMSNGDVVSISGVQGMTVANGAHAVTVNSPTSFTLDGVTGNASYTTGGQWAFAITNAYTRETIVQTASTTGLSNGDIVTITGATGNTSINGQFVAMGVQPTYFTLGGPIGNGAYTSGGYWTLPQASTTPVTGASVSGPITITTTNTVGLSSGDTVLITGVLGNTAANGVFTIANVDETSFSLNGSNGTVAYTSGGSWKVVQPITNATNNGQPIQITTTGDTSDLAAFGVVEIGGVLGNTAANGMYVVAGVTSSTITLGSPASFTTYTANSASWMGSVSGSGTVSWANSGGGIQVVTSSTYGLANNDLVSVGGVLGNAAANGFYQITNLSANGFTLVGSLGNGTFQYDAATPGQFTQHVEFNRLIAPKDIVEEITSSTDPNKLNNYFNDVIDQFFLKYLPSNQSVGGQNGGGYMLQLEDQGVTYFGYVTNAATENGGYVMRFGTTNVIPINPPTVYNPNSLDIYYPFFNSNLPAGNTPLFLVDNPNIDAPSWLNSKQVAESASQMIFACDAVFADNVPRVAAPNNMLAANGTIIAALEDSVSAAFNRGIALNPGQTWSYVTSWFPESGKYNYWVEYWHQDGLTHSDRAYGFPFDDKFGASTNLDFSGVSQVNITLGNWSATATAPTMLYQSTPPTTLAAGGNLNLTVLLTGTNTPTGSVAFFLDGRAINSDDSGAIPPLDLVPVLGGSATINAHIPTMSATGHTYTLTAVYSGDTHNLPSVLYSTLLIT